jgi:hypothetical protein
MRKVSTIITTRGEQTTKSLPHMTKKIGQTTCRICGHAGITKFSRARPSCLKLLLDKTPGAIGAAREKSKLCN